MDTKECENWQIRRVGPAASCRKVLNVMKLKLGVNSFGRSPDNDFFLDSKILKNFISRQHAEIVGERKENGETVFVLQEKGLNGTFINDVRIKGTSYLKEGDKITFGHTNGYKIEPGQHSEQPHSEFQFVFEKCPKHNGDLSSKRGLDSVEYHQTRTCCGNRKLPASPDYDRSECCDNLDKQSALKPSQSPDNQDSRVPPLTIVVQSWTEKDSDTDSVVLKKDSTVTYPAPGNTDEKSTDSPGVPDYMQEVEILDGSDLPEKGSPILFEAGIIEVKRPDQSTPVDSPRVSNDSSQQSDSWSCRPTKHVVEDEDESNQKHSSLDEDTHKFRDSENSVSSSRTDVGIKPVNGQSDSCERVDEEGEKNATFRPKSGSRPSSARSSSSYDECDGDVNGDRNIWNFMSNNRDSLKKDTEQSLDTDDDKKDGADDTAVSPKNHVIGRTVFPDNAQDSDTSLKRNQGDLDTNSMFSEDSDRERCLQAIHQQVQDLLGRVHTDDEQKGKSSDTKSVNQSTTTHKKRRKKRVMTRTKRSKVTSKDDEKLEDGVEWYEVETCAAFDCTKPSDRRVQWVQCDDCDQWFHTVCAGCRYDDVKDSQMEFHCGCA